jgi:glycosyltransferase involved in cell wall biosynthesis
MKFALGIPTFNRPHFVELHARSLCAARLPSDTIIIVVDDASTEYGVEYLESLFPKGSIIRRRAENSGAADHAVRNVMQHLLATDADAVMVLDSDMLVAEDFLEVSAQLLPQSDGILSLFNTPSHPTYGARGPFVLKRTIGSAGTLWRRDVAEEMFASVPAGWKWDWRFCTFLVDAGYEICVTRNSLVQHLGFAAGENSSLRSGDYGVGFSDSTIRSGYAIIEQAVLFCRAGFRQSLEMITSLQTRIDWLQGELRHYNKIVESASGRLEQHFAQDKALLGEFNELKNQIHRLCEAVEAQQGILGELVRAEERQSGRMKRVERMLCLGMFDRLSRRLRRKK